MEMLNIDSHDHRSLTVDPQRRVLYVGRLTQSQALARLVEKERKEGQLTFERHSCSRGMLGTPSVVYFRAKARVGWG